MHNKRLSFFVVKKDSAMHDEWRKAKRIGCDEFYVFGLFHY
jgi:hypothetical protein